MEDIKIAVSLKYLSNSRQSFEMLINCKVNLELTSRENCILASAPGTPATFRIINRK